MHIKAIICAIASAKRTIIHAIHEGNRKIMATLEEIQAAQVETDAKVAAVAADVTALLAKIAGFPAPGLTPEQQAAIDDIAAHAGKINEALAGVDAAANPAPRSASIAAMSMTASSASSYPQWSSTLTLAD